MGAFFSLAGPKCMTTDCNKVSQNETCKRQRMSSSFSEEGARLIPSLPDELSIQIVARLPRISYFNVKLVSRKWMATVMSPELYKLRKELGTTEEWVYLLTKVEEDKLLSHALDPLTRKWQRLPMMPNVVYEDESRKGFPGRWMWNMAGPSINISEVIRGLFGRKDSSDQMPYCGCAIGALDGCLYVLGGFSRASTMKCVWRFDPIQNQWSEVTSMSTGRAYCKTGILNNKLYVVGGVSQGRGGLTPLQSAEVFDPSMGTWSQVPSMPFSKAQVLPTAFLADMLKPIATGLTSYMGRLCVPQSLYSWPFFVDVGGEIYDPETNSWVEMPNGMGEGWPARQAGTKLSVVVDGELYAFDPSSSLDSGKIKVYDQREDTWKVIIGKVPIYDITDSESPYLLAGFHGKLHVITKDANHRVAVLRADSCSSPSSSTPLFDGSLNEHSDLMTESDAVVWRVVATRDFGSAELVSCQVLEIKRIPIEELCLQVKLLDPNCKIEDFLQKTLDPPVFETIRNAVLVLQDIGALSVDEKLTELGEKLGSLPVHPLTSKMLFFAILMNCLDPALTLACASDYKDPFTIPMSLQDKKRAEAAKSELASLYGGHSDQLAIIAAYECWVNAMKRGQEARFCSEYFVNRGTMTMLSGMRRQLQNELVRNGFIPDDISSCSLNARDPGILHAVIVAGLYPMVGRLRPPHKSGRRFIETAGGDKVCLHSYSINHRLSTRKGKDCPLIIYDEITRGDGGSMVIRNCTVTGPLPLLLLATEIAVAPLKGDDNDDEDNDDDDDDSDDGADEDESDEDAMEINNQSGGQREGKIMSAPENSVRVIVDRWLFFGSTALDVAQIYCLRERLAAAVLFKVTHPKTMLPPVLGASMHAMAYILSLDGLSGISVPIEAVDRLTSMVNATEIDMSAQERRKGMVQNSNGFPRSHMSHGTHQQSPSRHRHTRLPAPMGTTSLGNPSSQKVRPPLNSAGMNQYQRPALRGPGPGVDGNSLGMLGQHGPRGESLKRQRGNGSR